jgi:hypothetical protein
MPDKKVMMTAFWLRAELALALPKGHLPGFSPNGVQPVATTSATLRSGRTHLPSSP